MRNSDNILNTLRSGLSNARLKAINNKIKLWYGAPTAFETYKACLPMSN